MTPGTKLGPYEILSSLGAGGMGEVYRARDTRLERIVALKLLPSEVSSDKQALDQGLETKPAREDLRGNFRQCLENPDLDSADRLAADQVPAAPL
jgi:serine/threonine protein kinase